MIKPWAFLKGLFSEKSQKSFSLLEVLEKQRFYIRIKDTEKLYEGAGL